MEKIITDNWRYTVDELGRFHSFDWEPAVFVKDTIEIGEDKEAKTISWYRAWYKNWKLHREDWPASIRNDWPEFFYLDWKKSDDINNQ